MTVLILGLALWVVAHMFKRIAPAARAQMTDRFGDKSKGVFAILILVAVALIIVGYRGVQIIPVYTPLPGIGHLNNLLMLIALVVYAAGMSKGVLWTRIRHPQLWGTSIWAFAHLLVNGDLAAVLLFGTMLVWAQAEIQLYNAQEGAWVRPVSGGIKRDAVMLVGALAFYGLIAWVHIWLGLNPFVGTYG